MNKYKAYQEALNDVINNAKDWNVKNDSFWLLQELVDKFKPIKPLNQRINHNGLKLGNCNCKVYIDKSCLGNTVLDETFDFCKKCGQALDWSNK